jgi:hypothetical protein
VHQGTVRSRSLVSPDSGAPGSVSGPDTVPGSGSDGTGGTPSCLSSGVAAALTPGSALPPTVLAVASARDGPSRAGAREGRNTFCCSGSSGGTWRWWAGRGAGAGLGSRKWAGWSL